MNKSDVIDIVAADRRCAKAEASEWVNAVLRALKQGMQDQESITIAGFGTFTARQRAPRVCRHPSTGAPVTIRAARTISFRASPALKELIETG